MHTILRRTRREEAMQAGMRQMPLVGVVGVALVVVLGGTASVRLGAQNPPATYPELGVWKLNVEKSKYTMPQPLTMEVRKYETSPDGFVTVTIATVGTDGNPGFVLGRFKYDDGKDYPIYSTTALATMVATGAQPGTGTYTIIDAYTGQFTSKDNTGKVTATNTRVVSKDGKTLTQTSKDASGKVTSVQVFDKR
jgi:hypothetical protein